MKCVVCKSGDTGPGKTTLTLEQGQTTLVVKGVPAQVCGSCGEAYVDEPVARQLARLAEEAARTGVQVDVREFMAAPA